MTHLFSDLRERLQKRAQYNRTVTELRNLPDNLARDLNISRSDAEVLAYRAVYGS